MSDQQPTTKALLAAALAIAFYYHPGPMDEVCFSHGGVPVPCPPAVPKFFMATPEGNRIVDPPNGWACDAHGCGPEEFHD